MNKQVEGSYTTREEALRQIQTLKERGYGKDEILLVANKEIRDSFATNSNVSTASESSVSGETEDERSFWEKIKDAFTVEEYDEEVSEEDLLYSYHDDLSKGYIVILVNEKKDIDKPYRAEAVITGEEDDSMRPITTVGTGEDGTPVKRAVTDDIEGSKLKNNLPGRDGDVFHTDQLSSNKKNFNPSVYASEATYSESSDVTGTEDVKGTNPVESMNKVEASERSLFKKDKITPELSHPIDGEAKHLNETINKKEKLEAKDSTINMGKESVDPSEEEV